MTEKLCANCGELNSQESNFCAHCGFSEFKDVPPGLHGRLTDVHQQYGVHSDMRSRQRIHWRRIWFTIAGALLGLFAGGFANIFVANIGMEITGSATIGQLPEAWIALRTLAHLVVFIGGGVSGGVIGNKMGIQHRQR